MCYVRLIICLLYSDVEGTTGMSHIVIKSGTFVSLKRTV
jgi:hypothetical protein